MNLMFLRTYTHLLVFFGYIDSDFSRLLTKKSLIPLGFIFKVRSYDLTTLFTKQLIVYLLLQTHNKERPQMGRLMMV